MVANLVFWFLVSLNLLKDIYTKLRTPENGHKTDLNDEAQKKIGNVKYRVINQMGIVNRSNMSYTFFADRSY